MARPHNGGMMKLKTKIVQVRFDPALGDILAADADRQRLALSAWIRAICAEYYAEELATVESRAERLQRRASELTGR